MKNRKMIVARMTAQVLVASFLVTGVFCFLSSTTQAEVPPRKADELKADAKLIVTGKVRRVKRTRSSNREGVVKRNYAITVDVIEVEKGSVANNKRQVIARGFRVTKTPSGWAGPSGHYRGPNQTRLSVLKTGSKVRLFLTVKENGTYEILLPNGFEPLQ